MDILKSLLISWLLITMSECKPPNILIFMVDDLGYGDIGAFGNRTIRTPFIDQLAHEGIKLTQFLTPSPLCTPSRAALLTGRYPVRLGMAPHENGLAHQDRALPYIASIAGLPLNETNFAQVAKRSGYRTGYIGKWHVGSHCTNLRDYCRHPLKLGFDYFYGSLLSLLKDFGDTGESVILSGYPNHRWDALKKSLFLMLIPAVLGIYHVVGRKTVALLVFFILVDLFVAQITPHFGMKFASSVLHRNLDVVEMPIRFENLTQRLVWESVEFLEKSAKLREMPFLLYVSWFQVHTVLYNSVPEFRGRSPHGPYGDNVEEMDWSVGQVLQALQRLGLAQDTLVLFTSDNGGHVEETDYLGNRAGGHNGRWRGGKGHGGWDGGYRVPTVVRWPGVVPPNSVSDEPTSNLDVFPTLLTAMGRGQEVGRALDGVSLVPLLRDPAGRLDDRFLFQYCADQVFAVRWRRGDGVWKLRMASPPWLKGTERCAFLCPCFQSRGVEVHQEAPLYFLTDDPEERSPVDMRIGEHLEIRERMLAAVRQHQRSIGDVPAQMTPGKIWYRPWLQPCCNFPFCNCRDSKWDNKRP